MNSHSISRSESLKSVVSPPMSRPLAGCFARLDRVEELIDALLLEVQRLLPNYAVERGNDVARRRLTFRVVGPTIPLRISVLTGEIIHHLRSTFDHIAWAFAERAAPSGGMGNPRAIQFPVVNDAQAFARAVRDGRIPGMPDDARALTETLQPYMSAPNKSVLKLLHALDIQDKHQTPLVTTHAALMGDAITIRGNTTAPVTLMLPPPPSDGAFSDEEHGEAMRYLRYESDLDQPELQAEYDLVIDFVLRQPSGPSPQPQGLDKQLRHMAAFTGFALREFDEILRAAP